MKALFESLEHGYMSEMPKVGSFATLDDLSMYLKATMRNNRLDAEDAGTWATGSAMTAFYAGQYMAHFGAALKLRKPLDDVGRVFSKEETAKAEELEAFMANNYRTLWSNALFLHERGK